jgi:hypothetical protein
MQSPINWSQTLAELGEEGRAATRAAAMEALKAKTAARKANAAAMKALKAKAAAKNATQPPKAKVAKVDDADNKGDDDDDTDDDDSDDDTDADTDDGTEPTAAKAAELAIIMGVAQQPPST